MEKTLLINEFLNYFDGVRGIIDPISKVTTMALGLCDLQAIDNKTLKVILRRPELLIGEGGKDLKQLEKQLNCKIIIEEKKFV